MSSEYPLNFATSQAYSQPSLTPSLSTPPLPREYSSSDFRKYPPPHPDPPSRVPKPTATTTATSPCAPPTTPNST